jgi:phosphatidylserine decarboxylase
VHFLYHRLRESAPFMFRTLTSARMSSLLAFCSYDMPGRRRGRELFASLGADFRECVEPLSYFDSRRKVFERQIRYWETRPMNDNPQCVVAPADSRVLLGSLAENSSFFVKDKYFDLAEFLGPSGPWRKRFLGGDFAVFRLTPDKYHYNHLPVSGRVVDFYGLDGRYHSCNPSACIAMASLASKNRRIVTIIDTDVAAGSQVGYVAMIEIVALMIGDIVQAYSEERYERPRDVTPGMFVRRGCPKSLFRPGSSTVVLLFEPSRARFARDLAENARRGDVRSRFSGPYGRPRVETDVRVRSEIALPIYCS